MVSENCLKCGDRTPLKDLCVSCQAIETLKQKASSVPELISLYIPDNKKIEDVISFLDNSTEERFRDNGTINEIIAMLQCYTRIPRGGMAVFCDEDMRCTVFSPRKPLDSFMYKCGNAFELWPLEGGAYLLPTVGLAGEPLLEIASTTSSIIRRGYQLSEEACVRIGGHCYEIDKLVIATNPPQYTRTCKHCGKQQRSRPRSEDEYWE